MNDAAAVSYPGAFKPEYRDSLNPNEDQSHHFAAFVELGTFSGKFAADEYAYILDGRHIKGEHGEDLYNPNDVNLGRAGAELGGMLKSGAKKTNEVGPWIRDHICNPNPPKH